MEGLVCYRVEILGRNPNNLDWIARGLFRRARTAQGASVAYGVVACRAGPRGRSPIATGVEGQAAFGQSWVVAHRKARVGRAG
jgi:hypothetical protein